MDLAASGLGNDPVHIPGGDAGAGKNLNAARRVFDHLPYCGGAQGHVRFLPAGKDSGHAQLCQYVQRLPPVGDHVNRPVEHRLFSRFPGQFRQYPGALPVQRSVLMQKAENQSVRPVGQQQLRVLHRRGKLRFGIAEAALSGPDHGHDFHPCFPLGHHQFPQSRGQAAMKQIAVELHPVRSGLVGLNHIVRAAAADFQ